MNQNAQNKPPVLEHLERAVARGSSQTRINIMRQVTDLFLTAPTKLAEEQLSLFGDVINRLIGRLESHALAELSERLAPGSNAPSQVMRQLGANDAIGVAGPVLAGSNRLTDETLVEIAESKSQSHLSKIAERGQLSPTVTDILVDRGDHEVVKKLAANTGARFSNTDMSTLAMEPMATMN